jgi:hypothetical protein
MTPTSMVRRRKRGRQFTDSITKASDSIFQRRYDDIRVYLETLAKPVGSLATWEEWTARVSSLEGTTRPVWWIQ